MLKVIVGTTNKPKIDAGKEAFDLYLSETLEETINGLISGDVDKKFEIISFSVKSGVADQPLTFKETRQGAYNRAKRATDEYLKTRSAEDLDNCIAIGIESGCNNEDCLIMEATWICIIDYRTKDKIFPPIHWGCSPSWQCNHDIEELLYRHQRGSLTQGPMDLSQICNQLYPEKCTSNIGQEQGIVGIITSGVSSRKEYTKQGIIMALANVFPC